MVKHHCGIFGILAGIGVALVAGILEFFRYVTYYFGTSRQLSTGSLGFHTTVIESNVPELYTSREGASSSL